jgi:putative ATP-binding cassette transporter
MSLDNGVSDVSCKHKTPHLGLIRRLIRISGAFFLSGSQRQAWLLGTVILLLCLLVGASQVLISYVGRNFINSLAQRDTIGFYRDLWIYVAAFAVAIPIGVSYRYAAERFALLWREWMTNVLVRRYFFHHAYYHLRSSNRLDNPDQRIAEDVKSFTTGVLGYLLTLLNSIITLICFIGILWSVSWRLPLGLVIYTSLGTLLSILIGKRLVGLHFKQYQKEADFRYALIRVRENAESIAFFRGEKREHRHLLISFKEVVTNTLGIIGWNRNLGFFTSSYNYIALIIPLIIVGPMYMRGAVEFGVVTQSEGAFAQVLVALSVIISQFEGLSAFAASIKRVGQLWDELDDQDSGDALMKRTSSLPFDENALILKLTDLTVQTPDGDKQLTRRLNLALRPGNSLLIMGASGTGKSSLLRTIAGLWQSGGGSIERPQLNHLMFLPQRPYMVQGNLREQVVYPQNDEGIDDDLIRDALKKVNFSELVDRVGGDFKRIMDWTNVLSLGEQQRVSFARIFLHKPALAFLDESTSSLDEVNERLLYQNLQELGISFVSVGHNSTLKEFHDYLLVLNNDGTAELSELPKGARYSAIEHFFDFLKPKEVK